MLSLTLLTSGLPGATIPSMTSSNMDDFFETIFGQRPQKRGKGFELLVAAVLKLVDNSRNIKADSFVRGRYSGENYQLDALIENESTMVEAKDYLEQGKPVGRGDAQKLSGALQDLPIERGLLASATGFTKPTNKYATASTQAPSMKPIDLLHVRPSVEADEEGRVKTFIIRICLETIAFERAVWTPQLTLAAQEVLKSMASQKVEVRLDRFHDTDGNVLQTVRDFSIQIQKQYKRRDGRLRGTHVFNVPTFIYISNLLVQIDAMEFDIPYDETAEEIRVEATGKSRVLVKMENGELNILLTEEELKAVRFCEDGTVVMEAVETTKVSRRSLLGFRETQNTAHTPPPPSWLSVSYPPPCDQNSRTHWQKPVKTNVPSPSALVHELHRIPEEDALALVDRLLGPPEEWPSPLIAYRLASDLQADWKGELGQWLKAAKDHGFLDRVLHDVKHQAKKPTKAQGIDRNDPRHLKLHQHLAVARFVHYFTAQVNGWGFKGIETETGKDVDIDLALTSPGGLLVEFQVKAPDQPKQDDSQVIKAAEKAKGQLRRPPTGVALVAICANREQSLAWEPECLIHHLIGVPTWGGKTMKLEKAKVGEFFRSAWGHVSGVVLLDLLRGADEAMHTCTVLANPHAAFPLDPEWFPRARVCLLEGDTFRWVRGVPGHARGGVHGLMEGTRLEGILSNG